MNYSSKVLGFFLDLVYPPKCFKCGFSLIGLESSSICSSCVKKISLIKPPFCETCGKPFYFQYDPPSEGGYRCGTCRTEKHYFDKARSLGKYEGVFRQALISYKYKGRKELLKDFVKICLQPQNNYCFIPLKKHVDKSNGIDVILYVPLHKKKLRTRGFDQAFLIAKEILYQININ